MRIKTLAPPVAVEPPRSGEDASDCVACNTSDDSYIWVSERWRVRAMDRPTGLPMVLILECRSHLDLGDLPNLLAAELGVMTVRLERAIRSLDGVARVHVNRWGDGSAHLHMWFLARPYGRLQLRGTFLSLWDDILPTIPEQQWRENLALVAAWLGEFGGRAIAEPPHIQWQSPSTFSVSPMASAPTQYESASHTDRPDDTTADGAGALPGVGSDHAASAKSSTESSTIPNAAAGSMRPEAGFDTGIGAGNRAASTASADHANGSAPSAAHKDVPEGAAGAGGPGGDAGPMAGAGGPGGDAGPMAGAGGPGGDAGPMAGAGGPGGDAGPMAGVSDPGSGADRMTEAGAPGDGQETAGSGGSGSGGPDVTGATAAQGAAGMDADGSKSDSVDSATRARSGDRFPRQGGENPKQNSVGV